MKSLFIIIAVFFLFDSSSDSQESQNVVSGDRIEGIEKLNWPGIYRPTTDLNNFEYSTLGKDKGGKISGSSIGYDKKSVENNVELNKKIEAEIGDDLQKNNTYEITYSSSGELSTDIDGTITDSLSINEVREIDNTLSKGKVIQWTDENGVVHVTNDPTQIYIKSKDLN